MDINKNDKAKEAPNYTNHNKTGSKMLSSYLQRNKRRNRN